jgi:hypothetical protein
MKFKFIWMAEPPKGLIKIKDFMFRTAWRIECLVV